MTAPLTDDEARRVTQCDCSHSWYVHAGYAHGTLGSGFCPCTRADETLTQVAALVAEREAAALGRAAFEMGAVGAHRPPCRFPDTPCLCGVVEFRAEAVRVIRNLIAERES